MIALKRIAIYCLLLHLLTSVYSQKSPSIKLDFHSKSITSVTFSPDLKLLATGSKDWTVNVIDIKTGTIFMTVKDHKEAIKFVDFSSDRTHLISVSKSKVVITNIESRQKIKEINDFMSISGFKVGFADVLFIYATTSQYPSETIFMVNWGSNVFYRIKSSSMIRDFVPTPDGKFIFIAQRKKIEMVDLRNILEGYFETKKTFTNKSNLKSINITPDYQNIIALSDQWVQIWNVEQEKDVRFYLGNQKLSKQVYLSALADYFVFINDTVVTLQKIKIVKEENLSSDNNIRGFTISLDEKFIATYSFSSVVELWGNPFYSKEVYTQLAPQNESNPMEYPGIPLPKITKVSYDKINGSPYHNKKLMKGKIVMLDGDTLIRYLRYDMYMDQLEVVNNKRITTLSNLQRVDVILLNGFIYRYRTYITSEGLKRGFFIELVVGKCQLFRHDLVEYNGPGFAPTSFHGSGSATFFKRQPTYYYKRHSDVLKRLYNSESVLMDFFQLEYDIFSNYLSDQNLRLRKEKDLIQLFKHMNSVLNN